MMGTLCNTASFRASGQSFQSPPMTYKCDHCYKGAHTPATDEPAPANRAKQNFCVRILNGHDRTYSMVSRWAEPHERPEKDRANPCDSKGEFTTKAYPHRSVKYNGLPISG